MNGVIIWFVVLDNTWCITPHVPNAQPTQQLESSYPLHATVAFRCNSGYEFHARKDQAKCVDGDWELPRCKSNYPLVSNVIHVSKQHGAVIKERFLFDRKALLL